MKQKKARTCWVGRDEDDDDYYYLSYKKPKLLMGVPGKYYVPSSILDELCPEEFERFTGLSLEPGECKRVRINIEVL